MVFTGACAGPVALAPCVPEGLRRHLATERALGSVQGGKVCATCEHRTSVRAHPEVSRTKLFNRFFFFIFMARHRSAFGLAEGESFLCFLISFFFDALLEVPSVLNDSGRDLPPTLIGLLNLCECCRAGVVMFVEL